MSRVTIIIPNYNGEKLLPLPLESLKTQDFKDFTTVVVDNGSKDNSLSLLKERYPEITVIRLEKNYGFSFAVNRGIEAAESEYIALLNNDMEVTPGWLREMVDALDRYQDAGACNPKVLRYREPDRINVLGIRYNSNSAVEIIGAGKEDRYEYCSNIRYIFGVNAGASLYRRSMFEDIGLFDETFFASFEDVDLSFRAQLAGYKAIFVPYAVAYHMVGATIKRKRYLQTYLNNRNSLLCFVKNMPYELIVKNFPKVLRYRLSMLFERTFLNFYKIRTYYFLSGIFSAFLKLPYVLEERKKIQRKRRVSVEYIESIMDKDFL
ncbi:MAG: glycosyltransferase family 2 protein [Deltaproteobacteria bacterium]|nr:glycosyltransferase family 2 protein [Deltaproteobacteria bacterium]